MQLIPLKLKTTLILLVTLIGFDAHAGEDLIFKDSFEPPEVFELLFITPNDNQVVDQDSVLAKVRASLGVSSSNTLQTVTINSIEATVTFQNSQFAELEALIPLIQGDNVLQAVANYTSQTISAQSNVRYVPRV